MIFITIGGIYYLLVITIGGFLDNKYGYSQPDEQPFIAAFIPLLIGPITMFISGDENEFLIRCVMSIIFVIYVVLLCRTFYKEKNNIKEAINNTDKTKIQREVKPFFMPLFVYGILFMLVFVIMLANYFLKG